MKVSIITEAGKKVGFGHLTRCIALYEGFLEKSIIPQLIINGDSSIGFHIKGFKYFNFNWLKNQKKLFRIINGSDVVIIDSYLINKNISDQLSKITNTILYIDDYNRLVYPRGFVLNAAINSIDIPYKRNKSIKYLLGIKYALIKKEFQIAKKNKLKKKVKSILVTLGGFDKRRLTFSITKMIKAEFPNIISHVIIDQTHKDLKKIIGLKSKNVLVHISPTVTKILKLMNKVDIAVSAGGQTILELVKLGVPTIAVVVANNQDLQVKSLYNLGAVEYSGNWNNNKLFTKIIKSILKITEFEIRKSMVQKGKKLIDGKGPGRVISLLIKELKSFRKTKELSIRKIERKDLFDVFKLSNESDVRKSSFNSNNISLEDHKKWFHAKLSDSNTLFYVSDISNRIAGQIRAELLDNKALLSISVSKKYRKRRIGYKLVSFLISNIKLTKPKIKMIVAQIRVNNISSINFFKSLGFKYSKEITVKGIKAKEFIYYL